GPRGLVRCIDRATQASRTYTGRHCRTGAHLSRAGGGVRTGRGRKAVEGRSRVDRAAYRCTPDLPEPGGVEPRTYRASAEGGRGAGRGCVREGRTPPSA